MSSDLCEFDGSFFTDPFSPLSDTSSIDILKAFQENSYNLNPLQSSTLTHENLDAPFDELDQIARATMTALLPSSPPSHQLENLSLYQMGNSQNSIGLSPLEVKAEESQLPFYDYYVSNSSVLPHSYDGSKNAMKMMQRSYSSKSFDRRPNGFIPFQRKFDSLIESDPKVLKSNDHDFSANHMRRVCSTGDLQSLIKTNQTNQKLSSSSSPLATEGSIFMEEANFKVGRYSQEERKDRILRYKAKRTQRNFNKTIKYACRKTLADSRPRIRGRFARNDEPEEKPKTLSFQRYEDEDDEFWMDGSQEEYVERIPPEGQFFSTYYIPNTQFHRFTYFHK